MPVHNLKHGSITGKDAAGVPVTVALSPGPMDLSIGDHEAGNVEAIPIMNAGTFLELVAGEEKSVEFSATIIQDGKVIDGSTGKPANLVLKQGTFAAGTTRDPGGVVWTGDIVFTTTRAGVSSTCTLKNCRFKMSYKTEMDGNKLSISGVAYGTGSGDACVWS